MSEIITFGRFQRGKKWYFGSGPSENDDDDDDGDDAGDHYGAGDASGDKAYQPPPPPAEQRTPEESSVTKAKSKTRSQGPADRVEQVQQLLVQLGVQRVDPVSINLNVSLDARTSNAESTHVGDAAAMVTEQTEMPATVVNTAEDVAQMTNKLVQMRNDMQQAADDMKRRADLDQCMRDERESWERSPSWRLSLGPKHTLLRVTSAKSGCL